MVDREDNMVDIFSSDIRNNFIFKESGISQCVVKIIQTCK